MPDRGAKVRVQPAPPLHGCGALNPPAGGRTNAAQNGLIYVRPCRCRGRLAAHPCRRCGSSVVHPRQVVLAMVSPRIRLRMVDNSSRGEIRRLDVAETPGRPGTVRLTVQPPVPRKPGTSPPGANLVRRSRGLTGRRECVLNLVNR